MAFPTIQTCEKGSTAWTEVAADGGTEDDLEHPAPSFVVTAATGSGGVDGTHTDDGHDADGATARTTGTTGTTGTFSESPPWRQACSDSGGDRRPPQDSRRSSD